MLSPTPPLPPSPTPLHLPPLPPTSIIVEGEVDLLGLIPPPPTPSEGPWGSAPEFFQAASLSRAAVTLGLVAGEAGVEWGGQGEEWGGQGRSARTGGLPGCLNWSMSPPGTPLRTRRTLETGNSPPRSPEGPLTPPARRGAGSLRRAAPSPPSPPPSSIGMNRSHETSV